MIQPSDVALLSAIWRELDRCAGDEIEARWAVWDRMKIEPALCDAWLRHVEISDKSEMWRRAEEALKATEDSEAAHRAFRERIDPRENPATADRVEHDKKVMVEVFIEIVHLATEAWRHEREGGPGTEGS